MARLEQVVIVKATGNNCLFFFVYSMVCDTDCVCCVNLQTTRINVHNDWIVFGNGRRQQHRCASRF